MNKDELQATKALAQMGVTPHITHLIQPEKCFYSVVTVATPQYETYADLYVALATIYLEGAIKHIHGSALDNLLIKRFIRRAWMRSIPLSSAGSIQPDARAHYCKGAAAQILSCISP